MEGRNPWTGYQWAILGLLFLSGVFAHMDRVSISVVMPTLIEEFHLTKAAAGWLLSAFNWAYALSLLAAGPLVDWLKPRLVYPAGVGLWSAATIACGLSSHAGPLAVFRVLLGIGEAAYIPSGAKVISRVYRKDDRAKVVGVFFAGNRVGLTVGVPLAALVLHAWGWNYVFFVAGGISLVWLALWLPIYRETRGVLEPGVAEVRPPGVTWASLLRHRSTWALVLGHAGYLYMYYVFVTWLPSYLILQRHMSVLRTGVVGMLPFLVMVATTILGGWAADRLIRARHDTTRVRKLFAVGGLFSATVFVAAAAYAEGTVPAVTLLILSMGCLSLTTANVNAMPIDLAPRHIVSSLTSLQNFGGNVGGALGPVVTGILLGTTGDFRVPLLVTGAVALVFGGSAYGLLMGRLEPSIGIGGGQPKA
jgi:MFS family permease